MWAESSRGKNVKAVIKIYFVHGILQIRWIHDTILRKCVLFHPQPWMGEPFLYQVKITVQLARTAAFDSFDLNKKKTVLYCTKISTKTGVLPFFFSLIYHDDGSGFVEEKGTKTDFWMHMAFWFLQPKIIAVFCSPLLLISLSQKIKRPYQSYIWPVYQ